MGGKREGFYCESLIHSVPGRYFIRPFHKSVFICCAALLIKDEGDVDADTGQGRLPVWCVCEKSFVRASYSITDGKTSWHRSCRCWIHRCFSQIILFFFFFFYDTKNKWVVFTLSYEQGPWLEVKLHFSYIKENAVCKTVYIIHNSEGHMLY